MGTIRHFEGRAITVTVLWALLLAAGAPTAQAEGLEEVREFHIEAQALDAALIEFSEQADLQLMVPTELVTGRHSPGISGEYAGTVALAALLDDYGLSFTAVGADTVAVSRHGEDNTEGKSQPTSRQVLMAQNQASAEGNQTNRRAETESDEDEEKRPIEEIVVTGTNIRGIAPDSSPMRTFTAEDIQISGAATAQDFIQTLTTNFGGGANANIPSGLPNDNTGGNNAVDAGSFGASVNLRGLGSSSTLVLLNGHRFAPASFRGDFVDISMIPASAIERVETLNDGASSIYGSDAVAGVVNFILRDDFDGMETALRFGTGTQHGTPDQYRGAVTGGRNWDSGHALFVYEFFTQEQLSVEDRRFAQKDFLPNYLLPSQKRHSILASVSQNVAPNLELFADITYSNRKARQLRTQFFNLLTIQNDAASENLNVSAGGNWNISNDWFFDFSGTYSEVDTRNETSIADDTVRTTDSNMWSADAKVSGSLLSMYGGELKLAIGGHYRRESLFGTEAVSGTVDREAKRDVYAVFGEAFVPIVGPENNVPGIERLEMSISSRYEDYSDFGSTTNPKVGLLWSPLSGLNFRGSHSTSFRAAELGQVGRLNGGLAYPTSFINNIFGLTAGDPSIADVVVLQLSGLPPEGLKPETSRAFTAGFDFSRQWGPHSFTSTVTWFDIDFTNRLGLVPIPDIAFNNPDLFPTGTVIYFPTADELDAAIASRDFINSAAGADPLDAEILSLRTVTRNLSRTVVRGYDFAMTYAYDLDKGSFHLGLDGTLLQDVKQQAAVTTPLIETVDTLFNPTDLKLRGRVGYSDHSIAANVFFNFVDDYRVDSTTEADPIDSWTTVDLSLSYDTNEKFGNPLLNNTVLRLSVINLFDEDPPQAPLNTRLRVDGYDPANASPLGRFIAFEVTKHW